jgi:hypothetical protein
MLFRPQETLLREKNAQKRYHDQKTTTLQVDYPKVGRLRIFQETWVADCELLHQPREFAITGKCVLGYQGLSKK